MSSVKPCPVAVSGFYFIFRFVSVRKGNGALGHYSHIPDPVVTAIV